MKSQVFSCLVVAFLFIHTVAKSQIGINEANPHPSSALQISDPQRGVLFPLIDDEDKIITPTAKGLFFYNSTTNTFYFYDGKEWNFMHSSTANTGNYEFDKDVVVEGSVSATNYELNTTGNGPIPQGGIIMWSGTTIPNGWALCDGTNGTPDLRGKFIVGYDANSSTSPTYATTKEINYGLIGNRGGENNHQLSLSEMPSHDHDVSVSISSHPYHYIENFLSEVTLYGGGKYKLASYDNFTYDYHTHSVSVYESSKGSSSTHENRPPYYVLAFIMKL